MKKNHTYHLFLLLTTFTRGLVETFSLVLLYKKGFIIEEILLFLLIMYLTGILVNYISLKINYKIVLIISSCFFGISYLYLSTKDISLFILAILLSISNYSYHSIRHFLGLNILKKKDSRNIVNIMNLGIILSSIVGVLIISKLSLILVSIILIILVIISLIKIFKLKINTKLKYNKKIIISKKNILFNILEQFKVIFIELQPLFLYLYINNSIVYIGIFNIIISIASLIVVYFLSKKLKGKAFKYITSILGITLLLKINIKNSIFLLFIALIEGILVKLYDNYSLSYLYNIKDISINKYLIIEETIFFTSKSIIMLIFIGFNFILKLILLTCIIGIILSGLIYEEQVI